MGKYLAGKGRREDGELNSPGNFKFLLNGI
jgi:hypothetical protein